VKQFEKNTIIVAISTDLLVLNYEWGLLLVVTTIIRCICKVFRFGTSIYPRLKSGTIEYKENFGSKHRNCVVFAQWGGT